MIIKPPTEIPQLVAKMKSVFLAGAIDNGEAKDWQSEVAKKLYSEGWVVLNPRRDKWDSSWKQSLKNKQFVAQVKWELEGLSLAKHILVNFPAESKAPISLLELGLHMRTGKVIVCASDKYERYGNVRITCDEWDVPVFRSMNDALKELKQRVRQD